MSENANNESKTTIRMDQCNCAQVAACMLADEFGYDMEAAYKFAQGLACGMGGMKGQCGAITGTAMALGYVQGIDHNDPAGALKLSSQLYDQFEERVGSVICKEIRGIETGKVLLPCPDCIQLANQILHELLEQ